MSVQGQIKLIYTIQGQIYIIRDTKKLNIYQILTIISQNTVVHILPF